VDQEPPNTPGLSAQGTEQLGAISAALDNVGRDTLARVLASLGDLPEAERETARQELAATAADAGLDDGPDPSPFLDQSVSVEDALVQTLVATVGEQDEEIEAATDALRARQLGTSDDPSAGDMDSMKLQHMLTERQQMFDQLSTIIRKYDDTARDVIAKIGGSGRSSSGSSPSPPPPPPPPTTSADAATAASSAAAATPAEDEESGGRGRSLLVAAGGVVLVGLTFLIATTLGGDGSGVPAAGTAPESRPANATSAASPGTGPTEAATSAAVDPVVPASAAAADFFAEHGRAAPRVAQTTYDPNGRPLPNAPPIGWVDEIHGRVLIDRENEIWVEIEGPSALLENTCGEVDLLVGRGEHVPGGIDFCAQGAPAPFYFTDIIHYTANLANERARIFARTTILLAGVDPRISLWLMLVGSDGGYQAIELVAQSRDLEQTTPEDVLSLAPGQVLWERLPEDD